MRPNRYNIVVTGVGGQGLITLGELIGIACTINGLNSTIAEVHGMSQRGGSVIIHVRIGDVHSPIIPMGSADLILALEMIEAARYIRYAKRGATVIVNDFIWPPPLSEYPDREEIVKSLGSKEIRLLIYNANELSEKLTGSPISSNIAMLGFAMGALRELDELIGFENMEKALGEVFKGKALELNREVFKASYKEGVGIGRGLGQ
ncbi:MAG: indolepyruvate oxidoreductase subunit beta [Desulfurococcaceae archaeon]